MKKMLESLLSLIYQKKEHLNNFKSVIKYKICGFTIFKQIQNDTEEKNTYFKLFHTSRLLAEEQQLPVLNAENFGLIDLPIEQDVSPLVSVIVPYCNNTLLLKEHLKSIYNQTYKNIEVILSANNHTDELEIFTREHFQVTRFITYDNLSEKRIYQWNNGLKVACGEYIWIAEAEYSYNACFLEELVKGLSRQSVMLSFSYDECIDKDEDGTSPVSMQWDSPFVMASHTFVNRFFSSGHAIQNISCAVFRNLGTIPPDIVYNCTNMSSYDSWLFCLWLIRGGAISYTNRAKMSYRDKKKMYSHSTQDFCNRVSDMFQIACFISQNYAVSLSTLAKLKEELAKQNNADADCAEYIEQHFDLHKLQMYQSLRSPNVTICSYAITQGGGEIFPIYLANELKRQGVSVSFIDFRGYPTDKEIRRKLNRNIPLIELSTLKYLKILLSHLGTEVIHTHEGNVDRCVGRVIKNRQQDCKHVITLHGMYEAISANDLEHILKYVIQSCSTFVYIADKNLIPLQQYLPYIQLRKIGNGLPQIPITPHQRADFGIKENDFCLVLVSRAIPQKGWKEAVKAVKLANKSSQRTIHLILIGDGKCYDDLKDTQQPSYIHLLGRKSDVRNYFAMADVGLLPSRFKGESFPLVIIECMMSGKPVLASNIAEIRNMITDDNGNMAGVLFDLDNGEIPINILSQKILELANQKEKYEDQRKNAINLAKRFDIKNIAKEYIKVYKDVLKT